MTGENNSVKAGALSGRGVEMFQALRTDIPGGAENGFVGDVVVFRLDKDTADCLAAIAAESDATMYMTLLTIYNIILSIYTEKDKIVVGCPIAYTNTTIVPELTNYPGGEKHFSNPPGENGFLEEVKECVLKTFADNNIKESPVGARKAP
ncbi:MAG: hypothetical protein GY757_04825, partial [bacterium]|nr:hypothetical protein [bacterium]